MLTCRDERTGFLNAPSVCKAGPAEKTFLQGCRERDANRLLYNLHHTILRFVCSVNPERQNTCFPYGNKRWTNVFQHLFPEFLRAPMEFRSAIRPVRKESRRKGVSRLRGSRRTKLSLKKSEQDPRRDGRADHSGNIGAHRVHQQKVSEIRPLTFDL